MMQAVVENPKSEARNPKQISNEDSGKTDKWHASGFEILILYLFRISTFGFRISCISGFWPFASAPVRIR